MGYVFAPLTFNFFKKEGKIVALDIAEGKIQWEYEISRDIRGGVAYSKNNNLVFFGSEEKKIYCLNAKTGALVWQKKVSILPRGVPRVDDLSGNVVFAGISDPENSADQATVYVYNMKNGEKVCSYNGLSFGVLGNPCVYGSRVIVGSLDKYIHCFDMTSGDLLWRVNVKARCLASPALIEIEGNALLFIGANNGALYEINPDSGSVNSVSYFAERVVDGITYDFKNANFIVPTIGNAVHVLKKRKESP